MPTEIAGLVQNAFTWDSSSADSEPARRGSRSPARAAKRDNAKVAAETPLRSEPIGIRDGWLTTDQAVAYLGLPSRKALYQAVRRDQVPVHRLGVRRMRFSRDELACGGERAGRRASPKAVVPRLAPLVLHERAAAAGRGVGGDEDERAPDPVGLRPLQHRRGRGRAAGRPADRGGQGSRTYWTRFGHFRRSGGQQRRGPIT